MTPAIALGLQAGTSIAGGLAGQAQAQGEQQRANINAYIARTRAMQTDTVARQGMESELGAARAALGANEQRTSVPVLELLNEIRTTRERERRITTGNENTRAADYRLQGRNAAARGTASMLSGFARAGPSLFDLSQLNSGPR